MKMVGVKTNIKKCGELEQRKDEAIRARERMGELEQGKG